MPLLTSELLHHIASAMHHKADLYQEPSPVLRIWTPDHLKIGTELIIGRPGEAAPTLIRRLEQYHLFPQIDILDAKLIYPGPPNAKPLEIHTTNPGIRRFDVGSGHPVDHPRRVASETTIYNLANLVYGYEPQIKIVDHVNRLTLP